MKEYRDNKKRKQENDENWKKLEQNKCNKL
jgi:hypothetical protein